MLDNHRQQMSSTASTTTTAAAAGEAAARQRFWIAFVQLCSSHRGFFASACAELHAVGAFSSAAAAESTLITPEDILLRGFKPLHKLHARLRFDSVHSAIGSDGLLNYRCC